MDQQTGKENDNARVVLHRASWALFSPFSFSGSSGEIQKNGSVATQERKIIAAAPFNELKMKYPDAEIRDHGNRVLLPALVNAHAHLELSCFENLGKSSESFDCFTDWIKELLLQRNSMQSEINVCAAAADMLSKLSNRGVGLIADIGNTVEREYSPVDLSWHTEVLTLLELLGFSGEAEQKMLEQVKSLSGESIIAAHAPYSTGPQLIQDIKKFTSNHGDIFSIHVAETADEVEFLKSGKGCYREFLEERGVWDGSFVAPGCGAVLYLETLGVLDRYTLCVHSVHVSKEEIALLAERNAKVCLCPGSNRQLCSGVAPVNAMLEKHILPALGTDSLASNPSLDIWREMQILREDHTDIDAAIVFSMATRGGAESLDRDEYGELSPGKTAAMISVALDEQYDTPEKIYEHLTTAGSSVNVQWVH